VTAKKAPGGIHRAALRGCRLPAFTAASRRTSTATVSRLGQQLVAMLLLTVLFLSLQTSSDATAAARSGFRQNFRSFALNKPWRDGTTHGDLHSVFDGYGSVAVRRDGSKVLSLSPKASTSPDETHAALVTTVPTFEDFELSARIKTVAQLRPNDPNPWEVGWIVWNYTDNKHFSYLALKPNGWELGKVDAGYPGAQRFLATGSDRSFPIGRWNTVLVRQVGNTVSVSANGVTLVTFTDQESPYTHGSIGFYTEDARVNVDNVTVQSL
jgi:hypothetical protein